MQNFHLQKNRGRGIWLFGCIALLGILWGSVFQTDGYAQQWRLTGLSGGYQLSPKIRISEVDNETLSQLERVEVSLKSEQYNDAVETLREVLRNDKGQLFEIRRKEYIPVRRYGHYLISRLPDHALQLYRERVDTVAARWYVEGVAEGNTDRLLQVVDQMYCSRSGDDALLRLGELAFKRGELAAARRYWEQINPALRSADGRSWWYYLQGIDLTDKWDEIEPILAGKKEQPSCLSYPDSDISLSQLRARLALVSILEKNYLRAASELQVLKCLHPKAKGYLGGREVDLYKKLSLLLKQNKGKQAEKVNQQWLTFAGSVERQVELSTKVDRWTTTLWSKPITLRSEALSAKLETIHKGRRIAEDTDQLLSYHPVVTNGRIFYCDQKKIYAFDLQSGRPAWGSAKGVIYSPASDFAKSSSALPGQLGVPRFTLTVVGNRLFARLGSPITSRRAEAVPGESQNALICLDLAAEGALLWKNRPVDENWSYEGAPVGDGENIYVVMRQSDVIPHVYIVCYAAKTGKLKWKQRICGAQTPGRASDKRAYS